MSRHKVWISSAILLIVGLHALPLLSYQGHRQTRWPILAWAMYARSLPPGPIETIQRRIVGVTTRGEKVEITPYLAGTTEAGLRKNYLRPLWAQDSGTAHALLKRLNRNRDERIVELRVEGEKYSLINGGVIEEKLPPVLYRAPSSDWK